MKNNILENCADLLAQDGIALESAMQDRLMLYAALIREWNEFASLVSRQAAERLEEEHIADALSLAPWMPQGLAGGGGLLDIGSGGGFPAIPLKVLFPAMPLVLIERSAKKVGFLRKVTGALGLKDVTIMHGEFPQFVPSAYPSVITARAVERSERILRGVLDYLRRIPAGTVFLCQSALPPGGVPAMFHVEPVDDAWIRAGIRRGSLHRIWKREE